VSIPLLAGCYTPEGSSAGRRGIRRFRLDPDTGRLDSDPGPVPEDAPDASFLVLHPSGRFLYSVHETDSFAGGSQGAVSAWRLSSETGSLAPINRVGSGGAHPCHLSVDPAGRLAFAANYSGGTVAAFRLGADGSLGPASVSPVQDRPAGEAPPGRGVDPERQGSPHAHCILPHPSGRVAYAVDLGSDVVFGYGLDADALPPLRPLGYLPMAPGLGPRHLAFHPSGRRAYLVGELDPLLTAFACDPVTGALQSLGDLPLLPADPGPGRVYPSEVKVHPSGKLLVVGLRGAGDGAFDGFALLTLDADGNPAPAGHGSTGGGFTRHFAFDPSGRFLVAALQKGNALASFRIDPAAATLEPCGRIAVDAPACVLFP
jgi:6-phosphogluconolactonase